jgi:hypothetical protein
MILFLGGGVAGSSFFTSTSTSSSSVFEQTFFIFSDKLHFSSTNFNFDGGGFGVSRR